MLAVNQHRVVKHRIAKNAIALALTVLRGASAVTPKASFQLRFRTSMAMARTYEGALARLASLQSNKTITALFDAPATPAVSTSDADKSKDLNALAIPEMLAWLERAGICASDLHKLHCIHVAGTKGKGSVCAYLTSILTQPLARPAAGRVGTYTSPHLITVRERIQLDGQPISQQLFTQYFYEVWDALTASARAKAARDGLAVSDVDLEGPGTKPFFFRYLTIMAFHVFLRENVKSAVVESGIGGEYDSTNILPPEAVTTTVVTQLGIDHVGMLGGTLPEIAWHKAGICKKGRTCFTRRLVGGNAEEEAMKVLHQRAEAAHARLYEIVDDDINHAGAFDSTNTATSLAGSFQKYNKALAVGAALEHLSQLSSSVPRPSKSSQWLREIPEFCVTGLDLARLRGRCETHQDHDAVWYIDGAHTAESLHGAAEWFSECTSKMSDTEKVLVFNQQDRDISRLLQDLLEGFQRHGNEACFRYAVFTTNEIQSVGLSQTAIDTSVQATAMASMRRFSPDTESTVSGSVEETMRLVRNHAREAMSRGQRTAVLVTGSLNLAGAFLRTMEPDAEP